MHPIGQTDISFFFFKYIYIYFLPRTCRRLICSACCCAWAAPEPTLSLATPFFFFYILVPFAWAAPAATLSLSTPCFFFCPTPHTHTHLALPREVHTVWKRTSPRERASYYSYYCSYSYAYYYSLILLLILLLMLLLILLHTWRFPGRHTQCENAWVPYYYSYYYSYYYTSGVAQGDTRNAKTHEYHREKERTHEEEAASEKQKTLSLSSVASVD
jgi:hypothetical protein